MGVWSWTRWPPWRRKRPSPLADLQVELYTRRGCHLCDAAWDLLERERVVWGFQLRSVDVDEDAELSTLYGEQVPVVVVAGRKRFWGPIQAFALRRLLRAEAERRR